MRLKDKTSPNNTQAINAVFQSAHSSPKNNRKEGNSSASPLYSSGMEKYLYCPKDKNFRLQEGAMTATNATVKT